MSPILSVPNATVCDAGHEGKPLCINYFHTSEHVDNFGAAHKLISSPW